MTRKPRRAAAKARSSPRGQEGPGPEGQPLACRLLRAMALPGLAGALLCWAVVPSSLWGRVHSALTNASTSVGSVSSDPGGSGAGGAWSGVPTVESYDIVQEFPHDPDAFTQGLEFGRNCSAPGACQDILWESTGMEGQSTVREVALASGQVLRSHALPPKDFGEGLVRYRDKLIQLTWLSGKVWVYEVGDLDAAVAGATPLRDGWGITLDGDGRSAIVSDGSATLSWLDPTSLALQKSVVVRDGGQEVHSLNELEWVEGEVYANVWLTECIARIDPATGAVKGWLEMQGLRSRLMLQSLGQRNAMDVLNGIAYDAEGKRLFVTGKYWPRLYQGSQGRRLLDQMRGMARR